MNVGRLYGLVFAQIIFFSTMFLSVGFSHNGFSLLVVFPVIQYSFIVLFKRKVELDFGAIFIAVFLGLALSLNFLLTYFYWNNDKAQVNNFLLSCIGIALFLVVSDVLGKISRQSASKIINIVISAHVSLFLVQLCIYSLWGENLDYSRLLGGVGNRSLSYGYFRPTGVFDEPAIFGWFMSMLLAVRIFLYDKVDASLVVCLLCMYASLSMVSIILATGLVVILLVAKNVKHFIKSAPLMICLLSCLLSVLPDHIFHRVDALLSGGDGSTNNKFLVLDYWLQHDRVFNYGFGFIGLRDWTPPYFDAIYDVTMYLSVFLQFGVFLGGVVFCVFMANVLFVNTPIRNKLIFMLILVKMSSFHILFFWVLFAVFNKSERPLVGSV